MSDAREVWRRDEPDSPCRRICVIHPGAELCIGCLRTAAEIADWAEMSRDERRRIMAELPARAPALKRRRGGRGGRRAGAEAPDSQRPGAPGRAGGK